MRIPFDKGLFGRWLVLLLALVSCTKSVKENQKIVFVADSKTAIADSIKSPKELLQVDKIHLGMTIDEMKSLYPDANFLNEPVWNYGVHGGRMGIIVEENGERLFFPDLYPLPASKI